MSDGFQSNDSVCVDGGWIPGLAGAAAFTLAVRRHPAVPVLIAAPHGGRAYPPSLVKNLRHGESIVLRLEDRLVDQLAQGIAQATGAGLLIARAPRAMIDLNRSPDDIDWEMFAREARPAGGLPAVSRRARSGLGLIPRRLSGVGELWRRRHGTQDLAERLAGIHKPYHTALEGVLSRLREQWGGALLIDLHSMPPLVPLPGMPAADVVLGDRFGATCNDRIVASAFAHFAQCGRVAVYNRPYAGGYVLERHAAPGQGIHALQIEIDRRCYLDPTLTEPGPGMGGVIADMAMLVRRLASQVVELSRGSETPLAAE